MDPRVDTTERLEGAALPPDAPEGTTYAIARALDEDGNPTTFTRASSITVVYYDAGDRRLGASYLTT